MPLTSSAPPVKDQRYSVVCPSCYNAFDFTCTGSSMYGARCSICDSMVDLRCPSKVLPQSDTGCFPGGVRAEPILYAAEVEQAGGPAGVNQVDVVINAMEDEKRSNMPATMSGETTQAFAAQRNQAIAEKFSFLYPVTYVIEYLVFGAKPFATIGRVRIFRKKIPFFGTLNFCAPLTTTSYAAPCTFTFFAFSLFNWYCNHMQLDWLVFSLQLEWVLVVLFYALLFSLAYNDPGYIRPGYMEQHETGHPSTDSTATTLTPMATKTTFRAKDELTLKEIEGALRPSIWENVDGIAMERKWCSTCEMYRPMRAAHCYLCGLCCLDHDHHCSVIGVCVGQRRIERFATFVFVSAAACLVPAIEVVRGVWSYPEKMTSFPQRCLCACLFFPVLFFSIVLSMTAVGIWWSILTETTTRERLQHVYAEKRNPFSRGILRNLLYHLVQRRVTPSLFDDAFVRACAARCEVRDLGTGATVTCM